MIYFISFVGSTTLLYMSSKLENNKLERNFFIIIALLIPCILAGIRAIDIGTDVKVYLYPMYKSALLSESYTSFLKVTIHGLRKAGDYEAGFTFLVYIITKIFKNIHAVMFVIELLIILPVYFGIRKIKEMRGLEWLGILVYYFLFYHTGLNAMRQYIGVSIAFYGMCSILAKEKGRWIKYAITFIVSYLFHRSSILSISLVVIYLLLYRNKKKDKYIKIYRYRLSVNVILTILIFGLGLYALFNLKSLNKFLNSYDELERYTLYTKDFTIFDYNVIRILPMLIILIILIKDFTKKYNNSLFYIITFLLSYLVFGQLSNVSNNAGRISDIYAIFIVILYPLLINTPKNKNNKLLCFCYIMMYIFAYWFYMYIFRGFNQTYPFMMGG